MIKSAEKSKLKENFFISKKKFKETNEMKYPMGIHRWEAILDALKPNTLELKILVEFQNEAFGLWYEPGTELSVDDGMHPYKLGWKTREKAIIEKRIPPIRRIPSKPHEYGYTSHQMSCKSIITNLSYLLKYILWIDPLVPLKEHESLHTFVMEWNYSYPFHFVGDSKFGTFDFFSWRPNIEYYGTFGIQHNTSPWIWNIIEYELKDDCWRGMFNEKLGILACLEKTITQNGSKTVQLITNAYSVERIWDINTKKNANVLKKEELEQKKVPELQQILRSYGLKVSGLKADLIQRIISNYRRSSQENIHEYLENIKEVQFHGKSPPSLLYKNTYNATDLFDKIQDRLEFEYRATFWEEQLTLDICEMSDINAFVLYADDHPPKKDHQWDKYIDFRKDVADSLMKIQYQQHKRGPKKLIE